MFNDFNTMFPNKVHYESYCQQIKNMNISFVKLGEEQCEVCDEYNLQIRSRRGLGLCTMLTISEAQGKSAI